MSNIALIREKLLKYNILVEKYGETIFKYYHLPKVLFFYILSWKIHASKES